MFQLGFITLVSGIVTLSILNYILPKTDPAKSSLTLRFVGLYGTLATGVPIFAYLAHQFQLNGPLQYAFFIGFGSIAMVLPLIVIEQRAYSNRQVRHYHSP